MTRINAYFKTFVYFCSLLILFQSCTVYYKSNVTLEEAYESQKKVRIKTMDKKTLKYRHIGFENDKYLGYFKHDNRIVRIGIKKEMIKTIQIKNNKMSTILSILTLVIIFAPAIYIEAQGGLPSGGLSGGF